MGIKAKDIPAPSRASMDGVVPDNPTYFEWLDKQSATRQRKVLGTTRYNMWKSGEIQVTEFWKGDGRMMTLNQLKTAGFDIGVN